MVNRQSRLKGIIAIGFVVNFGKLVVILHKMLTALETRVFAFGMV